MSPGVWAKLASAVLSLIGKIALAILIRKGGADAAKNKALEGTADAVARANAAVDRLRHNPEHADRLRERFSRPGG